MKYSIEGFSQAKLLEYNLDILDAFLLRWFADFVASGSMKQTIKNGKIYYWIHYPNVIRELPAMGIHNTKSIALKFEKYVIAGILDKEIIRTQKGANVYYAIVDSVFRSLLYDNPQANENSCAESHRNEDTYAHGNKNSCAEKTDNDLPFYEITRDENADISRKSGEKELTHTKCEASLPKKNPQANENSCADSHRNEYTCAHENESSCAHRNFYSDALNDSTTNDSSTNDTATTSVLQNIGNTAEAVIYLKQEFKKYLNPDLFSADFWPDFITALQGIPQTEWADYIAFLITYTQEKSPKSRENYIYRIASKPFMLAAFFEYKKAEEKQKKPEVKKHTCIICYESFTGSECPECGFNTYDNNDEKKVSLAKEIYFLPALQKTALNCELDNCFKKYGVRHFAEYEAEEKVIYAKYGIKI